MRISVDLPEPLGPRQPKISPRRTLQIDAVDGDARAEAAREPARLRSRPGAHAARVTALPAPSERPPPAAPGRSAGGASAISTRVS